MYRDGQPMSVYKVAYYQNGMPATAFICAFSDNDAANFIGVRDGSAAVSLVASPVEIIGMDPPHQVIAAPPVFKAPPEAPTEVSRQEYDVLRAQVQELQQKFLRPAVTVKK